MPIIGILFVLEAGSSLIQIFWKKVFKKKLFISAPIHHHLEATGWNEAKIVMRFWVIAGMFAIIGIFLAAQGGIVRDMKQQALWRNNNEITSRSDDA